MTYVRVVIKHGEAIVRPDQPELYVRDQLVSPGEEQSFEVYPEEPLMVEAVLTEEMEKKALELQEADEQVAEQNEQVRQENEEREQERQQKKDWAVEKVKAKKEGREPDKSKEWKKEEWDTKRQEREWKKEQERAKKEGREPDEAKKPKPGDKDQDKSKPTPGAFVSSPAPKAEAPSTRSEPRSGTDSKEVKGDAPMAR